MSELSTDTLDPRHTIGSQFVAQQQDTSPRILGPIAATLKGELVERQEYSVGSVGSMGINVIDVQHSIDNLVDNLNQGQQKTLTSALVQLFI